MDVQYFCGILSCGKYLRVWSDANFSEWNEVFPNAACVVSLIDRLVHHSEVIAIEGKSFRMKEAQEQADKRRKTKKGKAK